MDWLNQFLNPTDDGEDARYARSLGLGNAVAPHSVYGENMQGQRFQNDLSNYGQLFQMMMLMHQAGQNAARQAVMPGMPGMSGPSAGAMSRFSGAPAGSPTMAPRQFPTQPMQTMQRPSQLPQWFRLLGIGQQQPQFDPSNGGY